MSPDTHSTTPMPFRAGDVPGHALQRIAYLFADLADTRPLAARIAEVLGCSMETADQLVIGERTLTLDAAAALAARHAISVHWMATNEGPMRLPYSSADADDLIDRAAKQSRRVLDLVAKLAALEDELGAAVAGLAPTAARALLSAQLTRYLAYQVRAVPGSDMGERIQSAIREAASTAIARVAWRLGLLPDLQEMYAAVLADPVPVRIAA